MTEKPQPFTAAEPLTPDAFERLAARIQRKADAGLSYGYTSEELALIATVRAAWEEDERMCDLLEEQDRKHAVTIAALEAEVAKYKALHRHNGEILQGPNPKGVAERVIAQHEEAKNAAAKQWDKLDDELCTACGLANMVLKAEAEVARLRGAAQAALTCIDIGNERQAERFLHAAFAAPGEREDEGERVQVRRAVEEFREARARYGRSEREEAQG